MRDKLVELLKSATSKAHWNPGDTPFMSKVADYLIAHGVTLAKDNNVLSKKPLTNGDRTRAMTDEELSE